MEGTTGRALLLALAIFFSGSVGSFTAAARSSSQAAPNWETWLNAVTTHTPGQLDDAVRRVAPWSLDRLKPLLNRLDRRDPVALTRTIERALLLHTDIAVLNRVTNGYTLPASSTSTTIFKDGRVVGQMGRTVHWEFARALAELIPRGDERDRVGRRFYRATTAILEFWAEYPELSAHLAAGRQLLGDDPVLLLYEGTMQQAYAGPRVQRFFDERRRALPSRRPPNPAISPGAPRQEVQDLPNLPPTATASRTAAERLFRRALAIDPTLAEARVRLAHVVGDAGRHDEAIGELVRATATPLPPLLDYYASLLVGRFARALQQLDAARLAFERAARIVPGATAPRFGLSELAMATGDRAGGIDALVGGNPVSSTTVDEPWWWLDRVHEPSAEALLAEWRQTIPQ